MPFQVGGVSLHDDYQHTGSAKRDVADGVAGLGPGGNVLAVGPDLELTRDGSENIEIVERTSGNIVFRWTRIGVNDFECRVNCGGVACIIQNDGMKDVVNGIASLDAAGDLLVLGDGYYLTRNGSGNMYLYERTSGEIIQKWQRTATDSYKSYGKRGGGWVEFQRWDHKDAVNGIAGLDANKLLDPMVHAVGLEEYSNHLGATDNFTQTATAGNGTANADAANHEMDLSTGAGAIGHAFFDTKKQFTPGSKPIVVNFLIQNIVDGAGITRYTHVGFKWDFTDSGATHGAYFRQNDNDTWDIVTASGGSVGFDSITALANGDNVTIVLTTSAASFFVNGALVGTRTANVPSAALYVGAVVHAGNALVSNARQISIDFMGVKKWH